MKKCVEFLEITTGVVLEQQEFSWQDKEVIHYYIFFNN